jgi:hypothetical protein
MDQTPSAGTFLDGPANLLRHGWLALGRLAARRGLAVVLCAILPFLAFMVIDTARGHDPAPAIHDEYGYLLAGDTFARGRLTNPTHPLWRSMETIHVLQRPTYQAKYPPGQGLVLALGTVVWGRPIVGVWICGSVLAAALCWMLQGWFPPRWALLGTLLGASRMLLAGKAGLAGALAYWSQSYWGGAVAALGGALVLGALPRLGGLRGGVGRGAQMGASLAMGTGAGILALTRPYEGVLVAVPAGIVLAWWLFRTCLVSAPAQSAGGPSSRAALARTLVPGAIVVTLALAWLALYNERVTGDALRLPYSEYSRQYEVAPIWRWQAVREEPVGVNDAMRAFARREQDLAERASRPWQRVRDIYRTLVFEAGPLLAPALLVLLPWTARRPRVGLAAALGAIAFAGMAMTTFYSIHYHAPAAGLTVILATAALQKIVGIRLGTGGPGRRAGRAFSLLLVIATILSVGVAWAGEGRAPMGLMTHWGATRQSVIENLEAAGGRHVVFVRYGPRHSPDVELVYNGADPDQQAVVWVRELSRDQNDAVLRYYADRVPWVIEIVDDSAPHRLKTYGPAERPGAGRR